jgi:hypothetical protein
MAGEIACGKAGQLRLANELAVVWSLFQSLAALAAGLVKREDLRIGNSFRISRNSRLEFGSARRMLRSSGL